MSKTLVIMAGGRSSRMKQSAAQLSDLQLAVQAQTLHKSLIRLGLSKTPLLSRLSLEASKAGIEDIIIVTGPENQAFLEWRLEFLNSNDLAQLSLSFAIQYPDKKTHKPMGTADAILQAMEQHPRLKQQRFVIANADNLYSAEAIMLASNHQLTDHALINYEASALGFSQERISSFALVRVNSSNAVTDIVEKPEVSALDNFKDNNGFLRVSMNLCTVNGASFYSSLLDCPVNELRGEKELPEAFRIAISNDPASVHSYLIDQALPDLTSANDLNNFN